MTHRLEADIKRRKEEMYQFYFKGIGISIKKRRLALKLTQEALAKGICSNTYVSKIENNAIAINKENLYLLMEKMDMPLESIVFPEAMIDIMLESFSCFIRKDYERYRQIYKDIDKYQFGILIQVTRFGYHILMGDVESARPLYQELHRYLCSLEQNGLTIFVIYACWYDILTSNYKSAKRTLEIAGDTLYRNRDTLAMCHLIEFIVYGHLYFFNSARSSYNLARNLFMETNNIARISEIMTYRNLFALYEGRFDEKSVVISELKYLAPIQKNRYLTTIALESDNPEAFEPYFDRDTVYFQDYLFILALHYEKTDQQEKLEQTKKALSANYYLLKTPFDYLNMLALMQGNQDMEFKEYLAQIVLPYVIKTQNIHLIIKVTETIVGILEKRKRYKDALAYQDKCKKTIARLQSSERRYDNNFA